MATRVIPLQALTREIDVISAGLVGDALKAKHIEVAIQALKGEQAKQVAAFGRPLPYNQAVDGRPGAPLNSVRIGGIIRFDFGILHEVVEDAERVLTRLSPWTPKQKGREDWPHYRDTHLLFIDGVEVPDVPRRISPFAQVTFVNPLVYSRRIELGWSRVQAPDGVYDIAERELRRRWGSAVRIDFTYLGIDGGLMLGGRAGNKSADRYPALVLRSRQ